MVQDTFHLKVTENLGDDFFKKFLSTLRVLEMTYQDAEDKETVFKIAETFRETGSIAPLNLENEIRVITSLLRMCQEALE